MDTSGQLEIENIDPELEDACSCLSNKRYPDHMCTKNEKRSIRRKAEKLRWRAIS
jgi:hypothetical protein